MIPPDPPVLQTLQDIREKVIFALLANPNVNPAEINMIEIAENLVQYIIYQDESKNK
jgi:DNA-directed RNA polymerase subunit K/omega